MNRDEKENNLFIYLKKVLKKLYFWVLDFQHTEQSSLIFDSK